jgi:hypothetical protein
MLTLQSLKRVDDDGDTMEMSTAARVGRMESRREDVGVTGEGWWRDRWWQRE